ncbi:hypothetical protein E2C01_072027 [Portunus trituberculatus]|uniref:Uncharacterized protein n=1 Tax=Portunus trituberculatus TaxID=210409 RepID=A0A5B7HYM6_PORTR|nr:hypothetical protein [Portunus trituberculatus]
MALVDSRVATDEALMLYQVVASSLYRRLARQDHLQDTLKGLQQQQAQVISFSSILHVSFVFFQFFFIFLTFFQVFYPLCILHASFVSFRGFFFTYSCFFFYVSLGYPLPIVFYVSFFLYPFRFFQGFLVFLNHPSVILYLILLHLSFMALQFILRVFFIHILYITVTYPSLISLTYPLVILYVSPKYPSSICHLSLGYRFRFLQVSTFSPVTLH